MCHWLFCRSFNDFLFLLTSLLHYPQYIILYVPHDQFAPQSAVKIKVGRQPEFRGKMQPHLTAADWFNLILPLHHIKILSAYHHMLIQRRWWGRCRVCLYVEGQYFFRHYLCYGFHEKQPAVKCGLPYTANSHRIQFRFYRPWKS